ncbi:MAG: glycosyltransferase family 4 protein [bacterium]|nr:glycosyltransferase family 4 protein [bacterium]
MKPTTIFVDHTHLGRHVTGLERITQELFSKGSLAPLELRPVTSNSTMDLIFRQNIELPVKLVRHPRALMLCPGFPPSFVLSRFGARVIPYIHDLFLLTRKADLNRRAKLYMVPPFRHAVKNLPCFMVNSQYTRDELRQFCRPDAEILLYRPAVRNIFGLEDHLREDDPKRVKKSLRLIALGTVEPRKNLGAAVDILQALHAQGHPGATLDIVGRFGWGDEIERLQNTPGVTLYGYLSIEKTRELMARADLFINTSHDEGLGLPLLEAQYGGLPVIAPKQKVFQEVLGESGLLVDPSNPRRAAEQINALISASDWVSHYKILAQQNLNCWNVDADNDRSNLVGKLRAFLEARRETA